MNDHELLTDYAENGDEAAFEAIVRARLAMVLGVALRRTGSRALAEEVAQSVFTLLARRAREGKIKSAVSIPGWLHHTALRLAARVSQSELSHRRRMNQYAEENPPEDTAPDAEAELFARTKPLLDAALDQLPAKDRDVLLLRFYENRTLRETGARLGKSESAAQRHVERALEKLASLLKRRGRVLSVTTLAACLNAAFTETQASAALIGVITKTATAAGSSVVFSAPAIVMSKAKATACVAAVLVLSATPAGFLWARRAELIARLDAGPPPRSATESGVAPSRGMIRNLTQARAHPVAGRAADTTPRYVVTAEMVKNARLHNPNVIINGIELAGFVKELLHITPEEAAAANAALRAAVEDCRSVQKREAKVISHSPKELELEIPAFPETERQRLRDSLKRGLAEALGESRAEVVLEAVENSDVTDVWTFGGFGGAPLVLKTWIGNPANEFTLTADSEKEWVVVEVVHESVISKRPVALDDAARLKALQHFFTVSENQELIR